MEQKRPVIVVDLFGEERTRLLELLSPLTDAQWALPTACPGWSVKDIAAHILGDDLNNLSGGRDGFSAAWFQGDWQELVAFVNQRNEAWVDSLRRLSPRVLLELLADSGESVGTYFRSLDPMSPGPNVAWAGAGPMPMWLHIAREYTERWLHQAHVREALGAPMLYERRLFFPVLDAFVHALPIAYGAVDTPLGTVVAVEITGEAGGRWTLLRGTAGWELTDSVETGPSALVRLGPETAWKLWTKGLSFDEARPSVRVEGDPGLGEPALRAVAIIA